MNANKLLLLLGMATVFAFSGKAYSVAYWGGTLPNVSHTVVAASVTENNGTYTYSYTVSSGALNTGEGDMFYLDISRPSGNAMLVDTLANTGCFQKDAELAMASRDPEAKPVIPITGECPPGFGAGLFFLTAEFGWSSYGAPLQPGKTLSGFVLHSPGLPGIRTFRMVPLLAEPTMADMEQGLTVLKIIETEDLAAFVTKTIGPIAPPADAAGVPIVFIDLLRGYVGQTQTLGWLTDPAFAATLAAKLDAVKAEIYNPNTLVNHSTPAIALLRGFMTMVQNASPSQMTLEAKGLLYYNAKYALSVLPRGQEGP